MLAKTQILLTITLIKDADPVVYGYGYTAQLTVSSPISAGLLLKLQLTSINEP